MKIRVWWLGCVLSSSGKHFETHDMLTAASALTGAGIRNTFQVWSL